MAPVTEKTARAPGAVIVAHGAPSAPETQERAIADLARRIGEFLPGWDLRGATLAAPGALEAALAGLAAPLVLPFFVAPGWFTDTCLPRRLGDVGARILPPAGSLPGLAELAEAELRAALAAHGLRASETAILIAAHGSPKRAESAASVRRLAAELERRIGPRALRLGFVEEAPFLRDAAAGLGQAICLPVFATPAGHVVTDLPGALAAAGFDGSVLPPMIGWRGIAALMASVLARADGRSMAA